MGLYYFAMSQFYYVWLEALLFLYKLYLAAYIWESLWCINVLVLTFFQSRYKEKQSFKPFFSSPLNPFPVNRHAHPFAQVFQLFLKSILNKGMPQYKSAYIWGMDHLPCGLLNLFWKHNLFLHIGKFLELKNLLLQWSFFPIEGI